MHLVLTFGFSISIMHLVLTFGFSISIKPNTNIKNNKITIKDKVRKKELRQRKRNEKSKSITEITQSLKNAIDLGEILAEIHVEYELLPNYNFKFDCRCWKAVTKIYTKNDDVCLRPISCPIKKDTYWIIFSIHHLVHLNEIQLKQFFNNIIVFRIFYGGQKFSERAKKDKIEGCNINDKSINIQQEDSLDVHLLDLYHSKSVAKPSTPPFSQPTEIVDQIYGDFTIITYVDAIPDTVHIYLFRQMLEKERFPPEFLNFESFTTLIENEEKLSSKQVKKSNQINQIKRTKKGKRKQEIETYEIRLPAEVMFSDMGTITSYNRTPQLSNISSILIYAQCQNILSDKKLRMNLNPISIKLDQLSNFPVDIIIEKGFKCIYIKIFFVNRIIVTPYYIPNRIMYFEFVKCFLSEEFQLPELINFLATEFLTVEIIGVRNINIPEFSTFIYDQPDFDKSKSSEMPGKEEVLLGVAEFDISDLLKGFWEVQLTSSLIHPRNLSHNMSYTSDDSVKISWKNSPLTADILTLYGTSVKIKVRPANDLRMFQRAILRHENILNRIFFNLSDLKLANDILTDVSSHNDNLLSTSQSANESDDLKAQSTLKHVLTGFVIEDYEKIYIFLEGLSNGYLLKIWEKVKKLPIANKCIYYNSSYVFFTRLYENFIALGGIVHIKLSESLETQLRKCSLYIGTTKVTHQSNVIRKLGLTNLTLTMKSLCQTRLFPKPCDVQGFIDDIHKIQFKNME